METTLPNLDPHRPPMVILPFRGSMLSSPPANDADKSFARSRTKYGLEPEGNVNRSKPARRVAVASILILLLRVREKYPGEASIGPTCQQRQYIGVVYDIPSLSGLRRRWRAARVVVQVLKPP